MFVNILSLLSKFKGFFTFKVLSVNIFVVDSARMSDYRVLEKSIQNLNLPHPARKMYIKIVEVHRQ